MAKFQSTRPVWGATADVFAEAAARTFQSTRPVWGATTISIVDGLTYPAISIHAPRVGRDDANATLLIWGFVFQSTRPVWGATV